MRIKHKKLFWSMTSAFVVVVFAVAIAGGVVLSNLGGGKDSLTIGLNQPNDSTYVVNNDSSTSTITQYYNGKPFKLPNSLLSFATAKGKTVSLGDADYSLRYYTTDGTLITDANGSPAAPVNAGTYNVNVNIKGNNAAYVGGSSFGVTILQRPVSVNMDSEIWLNVNDFTVNDNVPDYSIFKIIDGVDGTDITNSGNVSCDVNYEDSASLESKAEKPADCGSYNVTVKLSSVENNKNYTMAPAASNLIIYEDGQPMWTGLSTNSYNGSPYAMGIAVQNKEDSEIQYAIQDLSVMYGDTDVAPTNAGTYAVTADFNFVTSVIIDGEEQTEVSEHFTKNTTLVINPFDISGFTSANVSSASYTINDMDTDADGNVTQLKINGNPFVFDHAAFDGSIAVQGFFNQLNGDNGDYDIVDYTLSPDITDYDGFVCDDTNPVYWGGAYNFSLTADASSQNYTGTYIGSFDVLVNLQTALDQFNYANYYNRYVVRHYQDLTTGTSVSALGGTQNMSNIKQKSNGIFFFQTVTLGAIKLGVNPCVGVQTIRDFDEAGNPVLSSRMSKATNSSGTSSIKFTGVWTDIPGVTATDWEANYRLGWGTSPTQYTPNYGYGTYPENISNYFVNSSTVSSTTGANNGGDTYSIVYSLAANANTYGSATTTGYLKQVKAFSDQSPSTAPHNISLTIIYDKYGKVLQIDDHCEYTVLVVAAVSINIEDIFNYGWNQPINRADKDVTFTY